METYIVELTIDEMKALLDVAEHGYLFYDNSGYYDGEPGKDRYSNREDYITGSKKLWAAYSASYDVNKP